MLETMKAIVRNNDICVLATSDNKQPHTSLMAYAWGDNGLALYMITRKQGRKYENIIANPHVSVLIDTRCGNESLHNETQALTIIGLAENLCPTEVARMQKNLLKTNPKLATLLEDGDAALLRIAATEMILLDGVSTAYREKISKV